MWWNFSRMKSKDSSVTSKGKMNCPLVESIQMEGRSLTALVILKIYASLLIRQAFLHQLQLLQPCLT